MKVIIIGGVAAGMSAASKLKRLKKDTIIHVYEKSSDISYGGCGMPYFLSDVISDDQKLVARTKDAFEKKDIHVFKNHEVVDIDPKEQTVKIIDLEHKKTIVDSYDKCLIATGTSARRTNVPGSEDIDVFVLSQLEDARQIKKNLQGVKSVAVIGGGYIGLEIAENLNLLGLEVHIIELADQLLINYDKEVAEAAKKIMTDIGVQIHLNERLSSYEVIDGKTIVNTDKHHYPVDMVIEAIGVKPNTEFLKELNIEMLSNGAIVTNKKMETSIKNIYAAGDCVAYDHLITREKAFVPLGTHANKTGRIVGENMAGMNTKFKGIIGSNIIKVHDYAFAKTGVSLKESEKYDLGYHFIEINAHNQSGYYPGVENIYVRLIYDPKTTEIKGAQLYGKKGVSDRINIMALAISQKMTASEFAQSDFAYAPPFSPVWDPLLVAANQIKQ